MLVGIMHVDLYRDTNLIHPLCFGFEITIYFPKVEEPKLFEIILHILFVGIAIQFEVREQDSF